MFWDVLLVAAITSLFITVMLLPNEWRKIQRHFSAHTKPSGKEWKFNQIMMGQLQLEGIRIIEAEDGVYMSPGFLGSFLKPLFIPWNVLQCEGVEKQEYRYAVLSLSLLISGKPILLTFFGDVAVSIGKHFPDSSRSGRIGWHS